MKSIKSIVLVSGGLDSAVAASVAASKGPAAFLHVNYGQRTEGKELECFHALSDFFGVKEKLVADIGYLREIGGSALTDRSIDVPVGGVDNKEIPPTYVPFRNAHLLSIAVSWAEVLGAEKIFIGAVEEDSSGYPDCRETFFRDFERAVSSGTRPGTKIKIETPLIHMTKPGIVRKGVELNTPFHLTWSCYKDERVACGRCDSCLLRLRGFREAGVQDPITYSTVPSR